MVMLTCGAFFNDRPGGAQILNEVLKSMVGLKCIRVVMKRGRLRWSGHVERMDDSSS